MLDAKERTPSKPGASGSPGHAGNDARVQPGFLTVALSAQETQNNANAEP